MPRYTCAANSRRPPPPLHPWHGQGLGELAQRFPSIATSCIRCLRDFLVLPSPILARLQRQQSDLTTPSGQNITLTGRVAPS